MPCCGLTTLRKFAARFITDSRGNVAIIFAIALLPIIATVGCAVDYSRANSVSAALQSALDSTSLMIAKEAATDTPTQLDNERPKIFFGLVHAAGSQECHGQRQLHHDRRDFLGYQCRR